MKRLPVIHRTLLTLGLLWAALGVTAAPRVTAAADSAVVEMGSRATLTVTVNDPSHSGHIVDLPQPKSSTPEMDVVEVKADTMPGGYEYKLLVQMWTPGVATLPPFRYASGADTVESDVVTIKVLPVGLDSLQTINPMDSIAEAPSRWYDWIPDWTIWVVLGLALAGIGLALFLLYRKNGTLIPHIVKPVDPYEEAMKALGALRDRRLAESGHEKEFYTALVDILRRYLDRRFGINAMEMSSTQILASLHDNPETRGDRERIAQILELADFVKFAQVRPLPDDNIKTFRGVEQFVEDTKPVPQPEAEAAPGKTVKKK